MLWKKIVFGFFAVIFLLPAGSALAADQRCFTRDQCELVRQNLGEINDGFIANQETAAACGNILESDGSGGYQSVEMGFCLPVGRSVAQVSFGGKKEFANIGDYIKNFYNYSILAATVLAVVMIIIAGFQWAVSGGNSQVITSAQKRIGGSIIGLLLAISAYAILNTINPRLVQLRLPQVWLLNTINIAPMYCHYLNGPVAQAISPNQQLLSPEERARILTENSYEKAFANQSLLVDAKKAPCGGEYYVKQANGQTCKGAYCKNDSGSGFFDTCYNDPFESKKTHECVRGNVMGIIYNNNIEDSLVSNFRIVSDIVGNWVWPWAEDLELYRVCQDGSFTSLDIGEEIKLEKDPEHDEHQKEEKMLRYSIRFLDFENNNSEGLQTQSKKCEKNGGLKGFLINMEFIGAGILSDYCDEEHFIGTEQDGMATDVLAFSLNDFCIVDNAVFTGLIKGIADGINIIGTLFTDPATFFTSPKKYVQEHLKNVNPKYFISEEQLKNGLILNINVNGIHQMDPTILDRAIEHYTGLYSK